MPFLLKFLKNCRKIRRQLIYGLLFGFVSFLTVDAKDYTSIQNNQTLTGIATDNYEFNGANGVLYLANGDSLVFNTPYDLRISSAANLQILDGAKLEINTDGGPQTADWYERGSGLFIYNAYATVSGGTLNVTMSNATAGTGIELRTDNSSLTTFTTFTINNGASVNVVNAGGKGYSQEGNISLSISDAAFTSNNQGGEEGIYITTGNITIDDGASLNSTNTSGRGIYIGGGNVLLSAATINTDNQGGNRAFHSYESTITINAAATFNSTSSGNHGLYVEGGNFTVNEDARIDSSNTAGVGIYLDRTNATISNATINSTSGGMHGVFNSHGSTFTLNAGAMLNSTNTSGNGIFNGGDRGGTLILSGGTIISNNDGGETGIFNAEFGRFTANAGAVINLTNSSGNGIRTGSYSGASFTLSNATLTSNNTGSGNGIYNDDGGIFIADTGSTIRSENISGNGIRNTDKGSITLSSNTTLTTNNTGAGNGIFNSGCFTLSNAKLVSDNTGSGNGIHNNGISFTVNAGATLISTNNSGNGIHNTGNFTANDGATINSTNNGGDNGIHNTGNFTLANVGFQLANKGGNTGLFNSGTITLSNVTLTSGNDGGSFGIKNESSGSFTVNAGSVINSTSNSGTGIRFHIGDVSIAEGSRIESINTGGTGIFNDRAQLLLSNATINSTSGGDNGIYNGYAASFTINAGAILNSTNTSGNGIYNGGTDGGTLILSGGTIISNNDGGQSGIYNAESGRFTANAGAVINLTNSSGNGIRTGSYSGASFTLSNATLTSNNTGNGNGIYNDDGGSFIADTGSTIRSENISGNGIRNTDKGSITLSSNTTLTTNNTGNGDGIFNNGCFTLSNAKLISDNTGSGTGIHNNGFSFTVNAGATLNSTTATGNGIRNDSGASFTVSGGGTTLDSALTGTSGNGIHNLGGATLSILDGATLNATAATGANAIHNSGTGTTLAIDAASRLNLGGNFATTDNARIINNGTLTINTGALIIDNAKLLNLGTAQINNLGTNALQANNGAILVNDATLNSAAGIAINGDNVLIAGNGTYNAAITGVTANTRLSPGHYDADTNTSTTGTLNITGAQNWLNGFTYDWQSATLDNNTALNDYINIDGTLSLGTATYTLNASSLLASPAITSSDTRVWTLLTATTINDFSRYNWNVTATGNLGDSALAGRYFVLQNGNDLVLKYVGSTVDYYWNANTGGETWGNDTQWETDIHAAAAGAKVHFVRDQTAATTIDLGGQTWTLGNLSIGSQNSTATATQYTLDNGTITFDNNSAASLLEHLSTAQNADRIAANITLANDLEIRANSAANTLHLDGNLSGTNSNLTKTGCGTLSATGTANLGTGNLNINEGAFYLNNGGSLSTTGMTTVASGAILGGNGTLFGNLSMAAPGSTIEITGRAGAKYPDSFTVKGDLGANNGFILNLEADFSNVIVNNNGGNLYGSMYNADYASNLMIDGDLFGNGNLEVNVDNIGGSINIQDWTIRKNGASKVGFLLMTVTGGVTEKNWNLSPGMIADGWTMEWMDDAAGNHALWLFYANPVRIPEPGTYALLLGTLSLLLLIIRSRFASAKSKE